MPNKFTQRECKYHGLTEYVLEGRGSYRCKKCRSERVIQNRRNRKKKLIEEFGGKCAVCGYDKCLEALQFHHLDPGSKEFGISESGVCRSWDAMLAEAKKCILVCSNCHCEIECGLIDCPVV